MPITKSDMSPVNSPNFRNPPVVEMALSVQFAELSKFSAVHFGEYYGLIKSRYPSTQDLPRIAPVIELFPVTPALPQLAIGIASGFGRVRFISETDGSLLQLQPDRLVLNWRFQQDRHHSFADVANRFIKEFADFSGFVESAQLGIVEPNLCEVLYVNHVIPRQDESASELAERLLGVRIELPSGVPVLRSEAVALNRSYALGESEGRVYVEAGLGRAVPHGDILILNVTGRVIQALSQQRTVLDSLTLAHDGAIQAFMALTSDEVQRERWGRGDS